MSAKKLLGIKQPEIGQMICEIRLAMGLTQEQFAAEIGVVFPTVNRWENGHAQPSTLALKQIAIELKNLGVKGEKILKKYW